MWEPERLPMLAATALFQGLAPADLQRLLEPAEIEMVDPHERVITEGQREEALYVILDGTLKVMLLKSGRRSAHRFSDVHLNTLGPGDCFGEYSLIDSEPASASVIAATPATLLKLPRARLLESLATSLPLTRPLICNLLRLLVRRLRHKDQELDLDRDVG